MRISRVIISAVFIMIVGACFTAAAKEGAVPVLSFELEDGTQILDQDNVIKASLINRTEPAHPPAASVSQTAHSQSPSGLPHKRN